MSHLYTHRSHDYKFLMTRWRALAKAAGLKMRVLTRIEGLPVYCITSPEKKGDTRETIYLSAGVHGDEPAPPWGLLAWAEDNLTLLQTQRFLIFPVLNPHGLILNTRADFTGLDLNRSFHDDEIPLILAWKAALAGRTFSLALCLHEDYDAQGCYVYELTRDRTSVGGSMLADCASIIPPDQRRRIDTSTAKGGVIVRKVPPELPGLPEAIVLYHQGTRIVLTFESPSEFSLLDRVEVQKRFIASSLKRVLGLG